MRVLIGCEFSGRVREAFRRAGHDAWSCDLLPTEVPGQHYQRDIFDLLHLPWDILIAHPPCTFTAVSGARWCVGNPERCLKRDAAVDFARRLWECTIPRIALEQPVSVLSTRMCKPSQVIQPWQFGHGEVKATCLWLKGLPLLVPTLIVPGRVARVHREPPGPDRQKNRSRTFEGIANAMASQWGTL